MRASPPARPRPGRCRHRAARGRRNPRTGEAVSIPARTVPAFKAGKTLCGRLDGQHGEPAVRWHPFGREPLPGRPRSFATHPPQREAANSPPPSRILPCRRPSRPHAHCAPAITLPPPSSGCLLPPGRPVSMTFVAERGCQELADPPQVRRPAQTSRPHRIPRARVPLYGEPQDCSDDSAAGQCARLMHHLLPGRLRPPSPTSRGTVSTILHKVFGLAYRTALRSWISAHRDDARRKAHWAGHSVQ